MIANSDDRISDISICFDNEATHNGSPYSYSICSATFALIFNFYCSTDNCIYFVNPGNILVDGETPYTFDFMKYVTLTPSALFPSDDEYYLTDDINLVT